MLEPLSIGLNLVYLLENSGGAGTYARELIKGILTVEPETGITGFVTTAAPRSVIEAPWAQSIDWVSFHFDGGGARPWTGALNMGSQWGAVPAIARRRRLDLIHGLANITPLLAPGVATVVTLLDLIWLTFPGSMERRATFAMKLAAPTSARCADRVITISEAVRQELVERIGIDRGKIDVTHLGIRVEDKGERISEVELRRRLDLSDAPIVLCVAQKREHKNLAGLVRALGLLDDLRAILVLPGSATPYEQELRELTEELGISDRVRFPGWLSDVALESLYGLASCFVLPSFQEGFGLPILEAMHRDVPVACSNKSSMPEVAGDAALLFDPSQPTEIAGAIKRLLSDHALADALRHRGRVRCEQFTWEETARQTLATYRRAIADRRHK